MTRLPKCTTCKGNVSRDSLPDGGIEDICISCGRVQNILRGPINILHRDAIRSLMRRIDNSELEDAYTEAGGVLGDSRSSDATITVDDNLLAAGTRVAPYLRKAQETE